MMTSPAVDVAPEPLEAGILTEIITSFQYCIAA
jgi:hypothetical protein